MELSDTVIAAIISVGGMLGVAALAAVSQLAITRQVIQSEHRKIVQQIKGKFRSRHRERKIERLLDTLSDLVAHTDPEINPSINYPEVVRLIHRAQLLLDLDREPEARLNAAINDLGLQVGGYVSAPPLEHFDEEPDRRAAVLRTHGKLIDLAKVVIE